MIAYTLTVIGLIGFGIMGILWIEIGKLFFRIHALQNNREYQGYFKEYFSLSAKVVFGSTFVDFFPVSFLTKRQDPKNAEVEKLYKRKVRLERFFWVIFFAEIISIPIVELFIKPYLL